MPGLVIKDAAGEPSADGGELGTLALDEVPRPSRRLVDGWRKEYACLAHRPVWLIETARGCPFRCSFCSIWQLHARAVRERSIGSVADDFASVGDDIFVADDLFWYHPARSLALAEELKRRGIRKRWILVQSRVDLVARHATLLEAWRPIAQDFDIFFGLEAATNDGLKGLVKDATVDHTAAGIEVARSLKYGVTGNFVIDPAWNESDFEKLWAFRRSLSLVSGRLHDPDAASRHGVLRGDAPTHRRAAVGALRHASSAVGTGARSGAFFRVVLRDLAPLGAQSQRPQERRGNGCAKSIRGTRSFCCARSAARRRCSTRVTICANTTGGAARVGGGAWLGPSA